MLHINYVDAEVIKDGTSHLISKNDITGTSLEVLSFMVSGIEQSHHFNDGIDGRSRLFDGSEDKYRTVSLNVRMNVEYLQRIAHVRDSINELFSGEYFIREMRMKTDNVRFELPGQNRGDMNLGTAKYVNGKQLKVTKVSPIEIADDRLSTDFTVELETTDLPYFESIYTTRELNDSGYSATKEKYGIVDNIDIEKTQYSFPPTTEYNPNLINLDASVWENGSFYSSGSNNNNSNDKRMQYYLHVTPGQQYTIADYSKFNSSLRTIGIYEWDGDESFIGVTWNNRETSRTFTAQGRLIKLALYALDGTTILPEFIDGKDGRIQAKLEEGTSATPFPPIHHTFSIWNAGNVTIEPEFMDLEIRLNYTHSVEGVTIKNLTTRDTFILETELTGSHVVLDGMDIKYGSINGLRKSNRQRIRIVPGMNDFEVIADTFEEAIIDTKFYYR